MRIKPVCTIAPCPKPPGNGGIVPPWLLPTPKGSKR